MIKNFNLVGSIIDNNRFDLIVIGYFILKYEISLFESYTLKSLVT